MAPWRHGSLRFYKPQAAASPSRRGLLTTRERRNAAIDPRSFRAAALAIVVLQVLLPPEQLVAALRGFSGRRRALWAVLVVFWLLLGSSLDVGGGGNCFLSSLVESGA